MESLHEVRVGGILEQVAVAPAAKAPLHVGGVVLHREHEDLHAGRGVASSSGSASIPLRPGIVTSSRSTSGRPTRTESQSASRRCRFPDHPRSSSDSITRRSPERTSPWSSQIPIVIVPVMSRVSTRSPAPSSWFRRFPAAGCYGPSRQVGISATSVVPLPGEDWISSRPPSRPTRSRMPTSPSAPSRTRASSNP